MKLKVILDSTKKVLFDSAAKDGEFTPEEETTLDALGEREVVSYLFDMQEGETLKNVDILEEVMKGSHGKIKQVIVTVK